MATVDDLLEDIFNGKQPALCAEFEAWARASRRFRAFAAHHTTKMRAKLKNAGDEAAVQDLRAELETAVLLLRDERFTLEYEKYAASRQRGPDFTVTFRTHTPFNVEVRRIRSVELGDGDTGGGRADKLVAVLCDKVGQMPPSIVNLLWLAAERGITEADVAQAMTSLRQMAERKAEDFFARRGFRNAADFLRHYQQLSAIVLRQTDGLAVWLNPLARHKTPPEIVAAIQRLEAG